MLKNYLQSLRCLALGLLVLCLGLSVAPARAQSGPVGNEWIVPGQTYYKIKIVKDGLYKLDYQYLTQAGISGVAPNQLQIWRRGREIATYMGGNQTTLDPTSFIEFYALHNDGRLDAELYKQAVDQPHLYYSFYTDTASYFITWRAGVTARHMAQPVATGGTVHPHRLHNQLNLRTYFFIETPVVRQNYLPWLESGEGFFGGGTSDERTDSLVQAVATTGPNPTVEIALFAPDAGAHAAEIRARSAAGTYRTLGVMRWTGRGRYRQTFALQRSDVFNGGITVAHRLDASAVAGDNYYMSYARYIVPQGNRWFRNRHSGTFQNDSTLAGPATYEFETDSIPATAVGFDVQDLYNVQRVLSTSTGTRRRFVFPNANASATHTLLLAEESAAARPPLPARRVNFRAINPAQPNFIIITHPQLMKPAPGTQNAALAYASYRANPGTAGLTRYDTLMVTSHQLYDQFTYGDRSWLALRHFARWIAAANTAGRPRYLLLLGKGLQPSAYVGRQVAPTIYGTATLPRALGEQGLDLVPTSSRSVSDNMLTADYANNNFVAQLSTGRLTATTPAQVMIYLNKLREYDLTGDQPWRKNVLHLGGGTNPGEITLFRSYLDKYKQYIERPLFGGKVVATIERTIVNPTSTSLLVPADISPYLTPGLGLISYFGHGSPTAFSLDFGTPDSNPSYNNPGKYPVIFIDGCASANLFQGNGATYFESWLFSANKGAIGCMGASGEGYDAYLDVAKDQLTQLLLNDPSWYGKSIPTVYNETVRRLQSNGGLFNPNDLISVEQLLSTMWHGDPAVALYAPQLPDLQVSNSTLSIQPVAPATSVTASSTNFSLLIGVSNPLKVTKDSVEIRVTRTVNGTTIGTYTRTFAQGLQGSATYNFGLTNPTAVNVFGVNTFRVEIDYRNKVAEANETNNTGQINYTFLRGGLTLLNPVEFAIVGNNRPRLVAQTNDPLGASRGYEFEADTSASFNSGPAIKQTSGTVTATLIASWRPTLPSVAGRDSVVWYWRVRFQTPAGDEDPSWVVSSLRIIQGRTAGGWSQSHYAQFRRDQRQGVEVAPSGRWDFSTEDKPLVLRTIGGGLPGARPTFSNTGFGILTNVLTPPLVSNCGIAAPNLLIAVYDQRTLLPVNGLPAPATCGQAPQGFYTFGVDPANVADTLNTLNSSTTRQAQMATFLAAVPDGAYVAVVSMNRLRWNSLTTVRTAFSTLLGSQLVNQLQNGDPFALLAQKRTSGGRLISERGPSAAVGTGPRYTQAITLTDTLRTPSSRGTVTSVRIGPAQSWQTLYHWIQRGPNASSSYTLKLIGIDSLNRSTVLESNVPAGSPSRGGYALSRFSAAQYPYMQLELTMQDTLNRTAPQLKEWFITYQGVPEGVVRRDLATPSTVYDPATLTAQVSLTGELTFPVVFENVSPFDFGTPLRAKVEVSSGPTTFPPVYVTAPRQLKGDSTIQIPVKFPMLGRFGTFTAKVTVNPTPRPLPELNLFNNELNLSAFTVIDNNVPPTLDVAIDGRHILNGELVSSRPVIQIQLNDEDKLRHITDRSAFTVSLLRPGQVGLPTQVDLNGTNVDFSVDATKGSVAKLTFEPGKATPLTDGMYTLLVQGRDPSNAAAGSQDFQVKFEVVSTSQISNVYPYPNPVVGKTRFVFTLTGDQLPNNMKIQIMSLTGRVVREIFMSELGPLHIGNNVSEYAWDGTDTFGDRLANGTYLYRVALDDPNGQFKHRATAGDAAFKNDWGKLVLMR